MTKAWHSRAELVHQIVILSRDGTSRRAIARALDVSRNTVRAVLAAHARERAAPHTALPKPPPRAPRAKKVDGFEGRIAELFQRYPDITAQRVFETIGFAKVSTSGPDARRIGYLREVDAVTMNVERLIADGVLDEEEAGRLLERTLQSLPEGTRAAVLTGDIQTDADATRLARFGFPVRQITTGEDRIEVDRAAGGLRQRQAVDDACG